MSGDLYDCHCHLHAPDFDRDRDRVIDEAKQHGVKRVLACSENIEDSERLLVIAAESNGFILPALGLHPDQVAEAADEEVADLAALIRRESASLGAIGEIGLDFRPCWDQTVREKQRAVFAHFIALAQELQLPISVHSRSAGHYALDLVERTKATAVCMHGFDGRAAYALRGAERGLFFSLPSSLVRSPNKQKLARRLPRDRILLESDCPVLGPTAETRNEPKTIATTLDWMSREYGLERKALAEVLRANTRRLFPRLVGSTDEA